MNLSLLSPNVRIKIVYRLPFPTYLILPIRCVDWLYLFWKDFGSRPVRTVDCVFLCVSSVHAARVQPWLTVRVKQWKIQGKVCESWVNCNWNCKASLVNQFKRPRAPGCTIPSHILRTVIEQLVEPNRNFSLSIRPDLWKCFIFVTVLYFPARLSYTRC